MAERRGGRGSAVTVPAAAEVAVAVAVAVGAVMASMMPGAQPGIGTGPSNAAQAYDNGSAVVNFSSSIAKLELTSNSDVPAIRRL